MFEISILIIGGIGGVAFIFLPARFKLLMALCLCVVQLYILPGPYDLSLALVSCFLLIPEFVSNIKFLGQKRIILSLFLIIVFSSASLLWSVQPSSGFREILTFIQFMLIVSGVYHVTKNNGLRYMYSILNVMLILIAIEAVLIILFRLLPDLKLGLILSNTSRIFLGGNVLDSLLYEGQRNNFYDPIKSGGLFFINANAAGCYVGIASFLSYSIYKTTRKKITLLLGLICYVSVFFTGSKASALFAVGIPLFIYYLASSNKNKITIITSVLGCGAFLFFVVNIFNISMNSEFLTESTDTADTRFGIWNYAWHAFINNPIIGQGYGGWQEDYGRFFKTVYIYPPHNTIIYMWSKAGLMAAILSCWFIFLTLKINWRGMFSINQQLKYASISGMMVSLWLMLHGFGENFGLVGEQHQMPILAISIGIVMALKNMTSSLNYNISNKKRDENE
ncbi:TPA: O-antigen ligase family protein [Klebsiella pneumoniae]|uniref:Lipid A core - O-antigen ligase and related enzymes n=4 Tax=Klebsiella TaxID=570 RepID=A0A378BPB9_KLEPN|nr:MULTISPECIES: O-antigen ligase family protein [Enterobacterales]BAT24143.1 O-antigen polymerase [Klebsiella sp. 5710/52]MBX9273710.1 O-antigen ligase family protein [Klebsiella pneumoniae]MBY8384689.1 O-antigen ligase family protein [Klebsiella quasipneumoniae]MCB3561749.1 O-antigen ligase family protein [Klebsiella pneumoniae]MDK7894496.1 O-antigen ligase family protein [Klebsiella quasipneumoniae]